jgi:aerobic carbon-monoxide dehydrogenase small subunit
MIEINLTVNGRVVDASVEPRLHLADFLREHLRLTGTHLGCEHGVCGACTIEIDGVPARSCIALAAACDGSSLRTIEGFEADPLMAELREAFSIEHAVQCGFCTSGMLISARDIVQRLPDADDKRIRVELAGNLCRCTGYQGIVNAIKRVLAEQKRRRPASTGQGASAEAGGDFARVTPTVSTAALSGTRPLERAPARDASALSVGWTEIHDSFVVHRPPAEVWRILDDFPMIVSCLPGAELTERDGNNVKGRMRVKLGAIVASFAGAAMIERDDRQLLAVVRGAGSDGGAGSRTRGEIEYRLHAEASEATRVMVMIRYSLQGVLAQFSRSNLARDLAARLVAQFAANLNSRLDPLHAPASPVALDLVARVWASIKQKLTALFGR